MTKTARWKSAGSVLGAPVLDGSRGEMACVSPYLSSSIKFEKGGP